MFACYSPSYLVDLPETHTFPMEKYPRTYEQLVREGTLRPSQIIRPSPAPDTTIELAHTAQYLYRVTHDLLTARELRRLGFPWSPALVRRARCATMGTLIACHIALGEGIGVNLAGGESPHDPDVLTFSIHGTNNYPYSQVPSKVNPCPSRRHTGRSLS